MVMLGSYAPYLEDSAQYAWLRRDLASVDRARTPWLIAVMHAPWCARHYSEPRITNPTLCGCGAPNVVNARANLAACHHALVRTLAFVTKTYWGISHTAACRLCRKQSPYVAVRFVHWSEYRRVATVSAIRARHAAVLHVHVNEEVLPRLLTPNLAPYSSELSRPFSS